nr:DeoR/GlpR family DNA-binding transcription regulator [Koleobacter methoxysyntrophicus]
MEMIKMFAEERKQKICQIIKSGRSVKVSELSRMFNVSESTIRRDLRDLEQEGAVIRTHGGALDVIHTNFEPSFAEKKNRYSTEKRQIALKALEFIEDGDTIILDAGTTTGEIAGLIDKRKNITIVTNGINIAVEIAKTGAEAILIGGTLRKETLALVGPIAQDNINRFRVDKVFLGVNGISIKDGVTTPNISEAQMKKMMVDVAKEVFIVADSSKFDKVTFSRIVSLDKIDFIITDRNLPDEIREKYRDFVDIILA